MKRMLQYEIKGKLLFELDENTEIEDYLDYIRGIGEAEVVDVKVVEVDENFKPIDDGLKGTLLTENNFNPEEDDE